MRLMRRWRPSLFTAVMLAYLPSGAVAAPIGPTRPSQLVVVYGYATNPCAFDSGSRLDLIEGENGGLEPFSIPAGKVLIITKIQIVARGASFDPGTEIQAFVFKSSGPPVAALYGSLDQNKHVAMTQEYPSGLRVRSGQSMCLAVYAEPGTTSITFTSGAQLFGYLTVDR